MRSDPVPTVEPFYHTLTGAYAFLVFDARSRRAVIVDPVLDFDRRSGQITTEAADEILRRARDLDLKIDSVLETHAHADHLSAAAYIKDRIDCPIATGAGVTAVQASAARMFSLDAGFKTDGSQFDRLLKEGDSFKVGDVAARVIATPGHTPDSVTYLIGDCAFVGDTLFLPYLGTARCDFPGASARALFDSVKKLYALPETTRVMVGHDYPPPEQAPGHCAEIAAEKRDNVHLSESTARESFVTFREQRDRTLPLPELFFFALQVNVCAGRLPPLDRGGMRHFRVPVSITPDWA
jgi:glyoxylase-like metal-dependent hydrolase (beta-lactamase superfamily II)